VTASTLGESSGSAKLSPRSVKQPPSNAGHVVMAAGNAAWRNARPTSAGLKTFWPRPPKMTLPKPMATAPPTNAIHSGKPGGRISPSSRPVMMAEPSRSELRGPVSRSVTSAPATAANTTSSALMPKK
jgi:hypothetical protein